MYLLQAVAAQEITLESLEDGPGLLPFKLGSAKIITQHHSFLQSINIDEIKSKVAVVKNQLNDIQPQLNNKTRFLYEPHIAHLKSKLDKISDQLQTFDSNRVKRGLIDGLGSVIKSISGNLDYTDALRYNNAIKVLQDNEQEISSQFNQHISLSKDWMLQHSKVLKSIVENQKNISQIVNVMINTTEVTNIDLLHYAHLAQLLLILGDNIENLSEELVRIENLLAFIHAKSTHHSMLGLNALKNMIDRIRSLYNKEEILDISIREYFDIIKLGSYYSSNNLVIVFKVPIALPSTYDLYKLSIIPNKNHEILIPSSPYIAIHEDEFMYMETECPKAKTWYLCEMKVSFKPRDQVDCIQQLITTQKIDSTCNLTPVILTRGALEQLDDKHYTVTFPKATKVQTSCGRDEYTNLQGSFLVVLPHNCFLRTPEFTIINNNDHARGQVIKITDLTPRDSNFISSSQPVLTLNSINLDNLHASNAKITLQPPIDIKKSQDTTLYHTTIPLYAILLSATVLSSYVIVRRLLAKRRSNKSSETETKQTSCQNANAEIANIRQPDTPDHYSTLFSTKVLK